MALISCDRCGERLDAVARFCGACGAPIRDANLERVIAGRYVLRERIASGSLGIVYRAEQLGLGRKLAIKMLPVDAYRDREVVERFRREGEVLCRLRSPHTVTTYEFDRDADGSLYIAMELPTGTSLEDVLRRDGPLDATRALRIMAALCDSLGEAHELGVVHRDLRPHSVLVETRGGRDFVKVTDFGLAKLLTAPVQLSPVGQTVGAVEFCAPEQLQQRPIDGRTDLYALGILGYLMVTARHPFAHARSYGDMIEAQIRLVPAPASSVRGDLPAEVDEILARCLAKPPEQRYPTAAALAATIGVALAARPAAEGATLKEPRPPIGEEDTALGPIPLPDHRE
ncbi:MAG: protein kinase domain-containing protein [Acidobacteriota bacterium]